MLSIVHSCFGHAGGVIIDGAVAEAVRSEAIRQKAGLIVAGRGEFQDGIAGMWSCLYPIICEAPCPVLSI